VLDKFCPSGFANYTVEAEYADSNLLPNQLMTRADFLLEILGIWEQLRTKVSPHLQELAKEIDLVIRYTQNIYSVSELTDFSYLDEELRSATSFIKTP
jgi:hypothetical protein